MQYKIQNRICKARCFATRPSIKNRRNEVLPEFWNMFEVVIQFGAILVVVLLYFKQIWPITKKKENAIKETGVLSLFNKDIMILWAKILVACVPVAIIGIFLMRCLKNTFIIQFV